MVVAEDVNRELHWLLSEIPEDGATRPLFVDEISVDEPTKAVTHLPTGQQWTIKTDDDRAEIRDIAADLAAITGWQPAKCVAFLKLMRRFVLACVGR